MKKKKTHNELKGCRYADVLVTIPGGNFCKFLIQLSKLSEKLFAAYCAQATLSYACCPIVTYVRCGRVQELQVPRPL